LLGYFVTLWTLKVLGVNMTWLVCAQINMEFLDLVVPQNLMNDAKPGLAIRTNPESLQIIHGINRVLHVSWAILLCVSD
jgi:hypothetical protein